ncbi:uncharacterized protein BO66DRAFT_387977 [Aspergillus aculeatinus CBS 121060]|uniref:Uncharacterized protein n=1 Tax=Aspergillus aculeatinus CBS 121060 TaxID=1448322 RepID=A0ACD1HLR4_9EURO|nr:hypothetical protein BO66DRAFT_387977 [Aspergillus aculeatinus CBS 121060]RAH74505.1 hypothetical protein BO66DRAFT_387977 [Aspergillus aculeatinus CBS 121060]
MGKRRTLTTRTRNQQNTEGKKEERKEKKRKEKKRRKGIVKDERQALSENKGKKKREHVAV